VLSLSSLAGWEEAVLASLRGASGTVEERDRQIERSGLYGEYPAIIHGYAELFDDETAGAEALKRALFLVWHGSMAPPADTGIASLPDATPRSVVARLDARARRGETDEELAWMLAWYVAKGRFVFEVYGATGIVFELADSQPTEAWRSVKNRAAAMHHRGQLGRYWLALADAP
jgi:hypothetical protein